MCAFNSNKCIDNNDDIIEIPSQQGNNGQLKRVGPDVLDRASQVAYREGYRYNIKIRASLSELTISKDCNKFTNL